MMGSRMQSTMPIVTTVTKYWSSTWAKRLYLTFGEKMKVMANFTVEKCRPQGGYPRPYGYTLRMAKPHVQTEEDVEGVGLCRITPIVHNFQGWYKRKRDAAARAAELNH